MSTELKTHSYSHCKICLTPPRGERGRARQLYVTVLSGIVRCLALLMLLFSGARVQPALADTATTVTVSPSPATINPGETVIVAMYVNNVTDLYGVDIRLSFDPAKLEVVDADPLHSGIQVTDGDFLTDTFAVYREADNTAGTIKYVATQVNPTPERSGSGVLFYVSLRGKSAGTTTLHFTQVDLATRQGQIIDATSQDGTVILTGAPVITGQNSVSTNEDTARTITLADLIVTDVYNTYPTGYTLTVLAGTNYTFTGSTIMPASNFNGTLTVPVKVNDGTADSNVFNLTVTVTAVNDAPVANPDTYNTHTGTLLNGSTVLANDTDADAGDHLTAILVNGPARSSAFTFNADGTFAYTPLAGYSGTDTFTYKANDGTADSNIATVSITITAVEPPSFTIFLPLVTNTAVAPPSFTVFLPLILR